MKPAVKFLLILAVVALVTCIGINVMLGPPGLSAAYRADLKADHDHYLAITKSTEHKLYAQRPELHAPGTEGVLARSAEEVAFVEAYLARPAFVAERKRIALYETLFDFLNMAWVVIIILRFGWKPLVGFLDAQIAVLREKMEAAENARLAAEKRKKSAEAQMSSMPQEAKRVAKETQGRIDRELAELEKANQHSLKQMEADLDDRKKEEVNTAALLVKKELVNKAVDALAAEYRARADSGEASAHQDALIDGFADNVEALS